jgi:hypothetical protein
LPAGGVDAIAPLHALGDLDAGAEQGVPEGSNAFGRGCPDIETPDAVERDEVHVAVDTAKEDGKLPGIDVAVVHIAKQAIFEGDPPSRPADVLTAGFKDLGHGPSGSARHEPFAKTVLGRVK